MSIDKEKVNTLLLEFQNLLKKYRPNTSELQLINSKISQMTARNVVKQFGEIKSVPTRPPRKEAPPKPSKKWHKIKID